jgi:hypothetical protein
LEIDGAASHDRIDQHCLLFDAEDEDDAEIHRSQGVQHQEDAVLVAFDLAAPLRCHIAGRKVFLHTDQFCDFGAEAGIQEQDGYQTTLGDACPGDRRVS